MNILKIAVLGVCFLSTKVMSTDISFGGLQESNLAFVRQIPWEQKPLLFKMQALLEKNSPEKIEIADQYLVPPIIHMIWLGGKLPKKYVENRQSWINHHPSWTHILWVDSPQEIEEAQLVEMLPINTFDHYRGSQLIINVKDIKLVNQYWFDLAKNYGKKADILRYEILYKFGGVYVDTDCKCLKPCDALVTNYDFFTVAPNFYSDILNNCFIGAKSGHFFMQACVEQIGDSINTSSNPKIGLRFNPQEERNLVMLQTGPYFYSKVMAKLIGRFYSEGISVFLTPEYVLQVEGQITQKVYAVHYCDDSWGK